MTGLRRFFLDVAPLRVDRDYRWLWSGQVISGMGNQITRVALPFQVYVLTGSTLAIGALTLFQLVPILLFALGAGSLADAVDRRRLLMVTQTGLATCSLALVILTVGWVSRVTRTGRAIVAAVIGWGLAITAFGLLTFSFPLALLCLAAAGAADVFSAVLRSTLVQLETPDALRGRIMSIHGLVVTSGPRIGDMEAAGVAAIVGPQAAVVSGGVLCLLGVAVVVRWFPELAGHVIRRKPPTAG